MSRKRKRLIDHFSHSESEETEDSSEGKVSKVDRKRRRASSFAKSEAERDEETKNFENAISKGTWLNIFKIYGPVFKQNAGVLSKINLDLYDSRGMTSLHAACLMGDAQLALVLMKLGCNTSLATVNGWTIWHLSASHPSVIIAMIDFLKPKRS